MEKSMDSVRANEIHKKLQATLKQFAAENGLSMSSIKGNFSSIDLKVSVVFGDVEAIGTDEANPEYVRNLKRNGWMYGLELDMVGKAVDIGSKRGVKFQGLKGKKAGFKDNDGKIWLYDATLAAQLLKAAK
jgi:hypothetical protein